MALWPCQLLIQWLPVVKEPRREADHSPSFRSEANDDNVNKNNLLLTMGYYNSFVAYGQRNELTCSA
jgi:hypothetical protein